MGRLGKATSSFEMEERADTDLYAKELGNQRALAYVHLRLGAARAVRRGGGTSVENRQGYVRNDFHK